MASSEKGRPALRPWVWPAVVVVLATAGLGALRYPGLPDRVAVHFTHGVADRTARTSVLSAFLPVIVQVVLTAVIVISVVVVVRGRRTPQAVVVARSVLLLAACVDLAVFFVAAQVWRGTTVLGRGTAAAVAAAMAAGILAVPAAWGYATVHARARDLEGTGEHWVGFLYVNPDDPALFVPKRIGIGWTLNFGHPAAWAVAAVLLAVPVVGVILGVLTG